MSELANNEEIIEELEENDDQVSFKKIIKITYPIILSMFSLNIMIFIDRAFVAKYNLTEFAATVPAGNMATAISSIFIGVISFSGAMIAQYYGANKRKECSTSMWQGIFLSFAFAVILLLITPITSNIFSVMGHSGNLLDFEKKYFFLIICSSCVQLFITAFASMYRGIGNTKITMYVAILSNILNVILDWILIFGKLGIKEMGGVVGAGVATVISSLLGLIVYIILLNKNNLNEEYQVFSSFKYNKELIIKLIKHGLPSGIQTFVGTGYFSLMLIIIGKSGEFNLTCSNIAFTIEGISIFPIWGLGMAMSIIVGQERGAGRIHNITKALKRGILLGLCFNLLIIIVYNIFPIQLISIFNNGGDKEKFDSIINYTTILIRLTSIWIVFDTIQIVIGNVLRALGDTLFMMIIYLVMPFIFYIVLPYVLIVELKLSLVYLWIELFGFTFAMLALVSIRYMSGKWKKISVI